MYTACQFWGPLWVAVWRPLAEQRCLRYSLGYTRAELPSSQKTPSHHSDSLKRWQWRKCIGFRALLGVRKQVISQGNISCHFRNRPQRWEWLLKWLHIKTQKIHPHCRLHSASGSPGDLGHTATLSLRFPRGGNTSSAKVLPSFHRYWFNKNSSPLGRLRPFTFGWAHTHPGSSYKECEKPQCQSTRILLNDTDSEQGE